MRLPGRGVRLTGAVLGGFGLVAMLAACEEAPESETVASSSPEATLCRVVHQAATMADEIDEASGLAISRQNPGVVWTHNDSGDPVLYAIDGAGVLQGRVEIAGAELQDWEALAIADCPGGHCLYLGDIGDNAARRESIKVYRVAEPDPAGSRSQPAETFEMRYPSGPRDAEGLIVLPGERLFVVTKGRGAPVELFAYPGPLRSDQVVVLESVRRLSNGAVQLPDMATGATASPSGEWIAIRTYTQVLLYRTADLLDGSDPTPVSIDVTGVGEAQGEAIAMLDNGAVLLAGEGGEAGFPGTIAQLWCALSDADTHGGARPAS